MCGVFGIRAPERDVARVTYFGLFALQHRGQESAGIAVSDRGPADGAPRHGARRAGLRRAEPERPPGRGRDRAHALLDDRLDALDERAADRPARPRADGALGHNGNLTNTEELRDELAAEGVPLRPPPTPR